MLFLVHNHSCEDTGFQHYSLFDLDILVCKLVCTGPCHMLTATLSFTLQCRSWLIGKNWSELDTHKILANKSGPNNMVLKLEHIYQSLKALLYLFHQMPVGTLFNGKTSCIFRTVALRYIWKMPTVYFWTINGNVDVKNILQYLTNCRFHVSVIFHLCLVLSVTVYYFNFQYLMS